MPMAYDLAHIQNEKNRCFEDFTTWMQNIFRSVDTQKEMKVFMAEQRIIGFPSYIWFRAKSVFLDVLVQSHPVKFAIHPKSDGAY